MNWLIGAGAALFLCLGAVTPTLAHSPIMGIGGVFGGMLHALFVPEHGLSLLAVGLTLGRQQPAQRRSGMLIFVTAMACGLVAAALAADEMLAGDILLLATGILGLLIAASWVPPLVGWTLAAIAGVTVALDSRPEVSSNAEAIRMLIGSGLGAAIALAIVAECAFLLRGNAQLIVARVLGSWIAAIAILVLSLRLATRIALG